jgi:hypothetical protein
MIHFGLQMLVRVLWLGQWSIYWSHCMTGPQDYECPELAVGTNAGAKFNYDDDGCLDLRDYAEFQRRMEPNK